MSQIPEFLSTVQLAELLEVTTRTVCRWQSQGYIPMPTYERGKNRHNLRQVLASLVQKRFELSPLAAQAYAQLRQQQKYSMLNYARQRVLDQYEASKQS